MKSERALDYYNPQTLFLITHSVILKVKFYSFPYTVPIKSSLSLHLVRWCHIGNYLIII
jgi:hypothetical protein